MEIVDIVCLLGKDPVSTRDAFTKNYKTRIRFSSIAFHPDDDSEQPGNQSESETLLVPSELENSYLPEETETAVSAVVPGRGRRTGSACGLRRPLTGLPCWTCTEVSEYWMDGLPSALTGLPCWTRIKETESWPGDSVMPADATWVGLPFCFCSFGLLDEELVVIFKLS